MPEPSDSAHSEFSAFFRRHHARVLRSTYVVVQDREAAQDLTQEAFLVTWRHWAKVSGYDRPDLWAERVSVRLAIRHATRARRRRTREPRDTDLVAHAPPADLDLLRRIAALPASQRAAIVLFYLEDRPLAEVARVLGCSESTARVHVHRGRAKLATLIAQEEGAREGR